MAAIVERCRRVYVIGEHRSGPVKIGVAEDPEKRLAELQIGNPRKLFLFRSFESPRSADIEAWFHRCFLSRLIRGEWFDLDVSSSAKELARGVRLAESGEISAYAKSPNLRERDGAVERLCSKCGHWKSIDCYYRSRQKKHGTQMRCIECTKNALIEWRSRPGVAERMNRRESARRRAVRAGLRAARAVIDPT